MRYTELTEKPHRTLILKIVLKFIEILIKILILKGSALIYAERCILCVPFQLKNIKITFFLSLLLSRRRQFKSLRLRWSKDSTGSTSESARLTYAIYLKHLCCHPDLFKEDRGNFSNDKLYILTLLCEVNFYCCHYCCYHDCYC